MQAGSGQKVTIRYNYDTLALQSRYYLILHDPNLAVNTYVT